MQHINPHSPSIQTFPIIILEKSLNDQILIANFFFCFSLQRKVIHFASHQMPRKVYTKSISFLVLFALKIWKMRQSLFISDKKL